MDLAAILVVKVDTDVVAMAQNQLCALRVRLSSDLQAVDGRHSDRHTLDNLSFRIFHEQLEIELQGEKSKL